MGSKDYLCEFFNKLNENRPTSKINIIKSNIIRLNQKKTISNSEGDQTGQEKSRRSFKQAKKAVQPMEP